MENRVTKREMYEALVSFAVNGEMSYETEEGAVVVSMDELKAFAENEIAQLDKKLEKARERAAAKKAEADVLMDRVKEVLTDEYQTIADIMVVLNDEDVTAGKVTARLTKLVKAGEAEKTDVKVDKRTVKGYRRANPEEPQVEYHIDEKLRFDM